MRLLRFHPYMAEETGADGKGGGGGSGDGKGGDGKGADGTGGSGDGKGDGDPLKVLQAKVDELLAKQAASDKALADAKADADAKAEAERQKGLSEAQRLSEQLSASNARLAELENVQKADARKALLGQLRVDPDFQDMAPQVDARTAEGKAAIEAWVQARPKVRLGSGTTIPDTTALQQRFTDGKTKLSPVVNVDSVRASFESIRRAVQHFKD